MGVAGIGWAAIVSLPFAIMSEVVDKSKMGYYMGMFNLSIVIPQLLVSLVVGYIVMSSDNKNIVFYYKRCFHLQFSSLLLDDCKGKRKN